MAHHDIVVIGASAGGVEALTRLVRGLPASLFVVCHCPSGHRSVLSEILSLAGPLLASHAIDGELIHPGHIFEKMPDIVNADMSEQVRNEKRGRIAVFTCPDCGGSLGQMDEKKLVQFRCHVGHVFQGETLLEDQANLLEAAVDGDSHL